MKARSGQVTFASTWYNRLTDFYLESESSKVLNAAYQQDAAVLTPHPQAHALYADKRNLVLWSDPQALAALGVPSATREVLLAGVPRTVAVDGANAEELWAARRRLFFKPFAGYGSRAAYRGDKVTQRVWSEIVAGGYVAQALVAPGERRLEAAADKPLKFDLREYVYDGRIQWSAARLYQGQTTNFRTPGSGFAPCTRARSRQSRSVPELAARRRGSRLVQAIGRFIPHAHADAVAAHLFPKRLARNAERSCCRSDAAAMRSSKAIRRTQAPVSMRFCSSRTLWQTISSAKAMP